MSTPLLSINQVVKQYESTLAVDHISLSIPEGCIFGLLGPNGAGKTTLIRMITTILYQDSGTIELHNIPPNTNRSLYIGYMPEERGLYKKMKVGEHLLYLARLKGFSAKEAREKVDFWLDKLAIADWKNRPIEELSKGMQQKIQFIAAVVHEPKLIILDEPFSGLDPINANIIQDEIFALRQRGSTIIFSTHRMEQVEQICEQIALVNKGRIVLNGNVADIKQQFKKNLFSVGYTHTLPNLPDAPFNIIENQNNVLTIALIADIKPHNVLQYLLSKEVSVVSFNEILPSLHEIFVQQVNN
jgi:ABC-2 type transport system ATP-binding protein